MNTNELLYFATKGVKHDINVVEKLIAIAKQENNIKALVELYKKMEYLNNCLKYLETENFIQESINNSAKIIVY